MECDKGERIMSTVFKRYYWQTIGSLEGHVGIYDSKEKHKMLAMIPKRKDKIDVADLIVRALNDYPSRKNN